MNTLESLKDETMKLFRGLMDGTVRFSYDSMNCAMKTDICEAFNDIAEEFVMSVLEGEDVTAEKLQAFYDGLVAFGDDFKVKEAKALAKKVKTVIDNQA